ncbi:TonB-dependent receptor [Pseudohongiella spirulinae]|uniref:TonB-dependent receptor n=1 Tax=Pseudohongiella spirulinae TaxID=1249552 RepID=A0A0S2KFX9_9GAMM|nr:TonB-dependent receptor [Pseudohongiella spirulinae]ALO46866.1 TonB-dependent receptor [Pseudohongiella spirulinae]
MQNSHRFTPHKLLVAMLMASAGTGAVAQTTELEEILVFGQRAAQNKALDEYRRANSITNYIAADDMGQFVDQNVAESLQRLPGISISRDQGEGRFVSVRGIDAGLSTVTINGMRIGTPEDGSRAVPLDVIPTGSVELLEVTKVPTPDMPGDAIGGSVNVRSASAFDREGQQLAYRAEASYNELSGETSPKGQIDFSDVYSAFGGTENLGVTFGLNYTERQMESDNVEAEYDFLDFNGSDVFSVIELQERKYDLARERTGANLNLEYRPDDRTRLHASTVYSNFKDAETRQRTIYVFEDGDLTSFNGSAAVYEDIDEDGFRRRIRFRTKDQDTLAFNAGGEHDFSQWRLDYNVGISDTKERVLDEKEGRFEKTGDALNADVLIGGGLPSFTIRNGNAVTREHLINSNYELDRVVVEPILVDDRDVNFNINMEVPEAFGINTLTVKAGLDGRFKEKDINVDEIELRRTPDVNLAQFTTNPYSHGLADMGEGISSAGFMSFYDQNQSLFTARPQDVDENTELSLSQDFVADEDVTAAYMMGTWELDRLRIIAGGRVERTEYSARGNELVYGVDGSLSVNARNVNSKYTDFLPGLHVRYEPTDDLVIRAAWSNTIARPSFGDISPRSVVDRDRLRIDAGNPDLDPYKATNFDLLADWYFGDSGVVSAGVFYKDIEDYIVEFTSRNNPAFGGYDVTQPINGTEASVKGIEFNAQQGLEIFSESLTGLLAGVNVTLLDTELKLSQRTGENFMLPAAAEESGNIYIGYENERFSTRLSATYRGKMLDEVGDDTNFDIYVASHTQVDLTASYRFSDRLELVAELINLTDEPLELYQGSKGYTLQLEEYGPTFAFGIKGRF